MNQSNDNKNECSPKLPTGISGLDKVLYGGLMLITRIIMKSPLLLS